uniref:Uncharacterized protein n=1 Tax=Arundo donax TaxID=35708 RepID=A0A0A9PMT1_ARUDO
MCRCHVLFPRGRCARGAENRIKRPESGARNCAEAICSEDDKRGGCISSCICCFVMSSLLCSAVKYNYVMYEYWPASCVPNYIISFDSSYVL